MLESNDPKSREETPQEGHCNIDAAMQKNSVRCTKCKSQMQDFFFMLRKTNMTKANYLSFAHELADIAAAQILPLFRAVSAQNKGGSARYDPVTEADKAAEAAMRDAIVKRYPEHGIIGEEYASYQPEAEFQWILDPIDGTRGFLAGMPSWGTLIGLLHKGEPMIGMMAQAYVNERFYGDGETAFCRKADGSVVALQSSGEQDIAQVFMGTTTPDMFKADEWAAYKNLHNAVRDTRYGTDCYGYALLAAGSLGIVCEADLKPYDILPMVPVLKGAGAVVSTWSGADVTDAQALKSGRIVAAGNKALHAKALALLKG